jgi:hypothetical protein
VVAHGFIVGSSSTFVENIVEIRVVETKSSPHLLFGYIYFVQTLIVPLCRRSTYQTAILNFNLSSFTISSFCASSSSTSQHTDR